MGLPKFYKWLLRRYPLISSRVRSAEDLPPISLLCIDINDILHSCIHGETLDKYILCSKLLAGGKRAKEIWNEIFRSIDDAVHLARPKKVLYIAMDGVSSASKLEIKRYRRTKTSTEMKDLAEIAQLQKVAEPLDENVLNPGTEFMEEIKKVLEEFVAKKISEDDYWKGLEVILSDTAVPGEGEHKIIDFIKRQVKGNSDSVCIFGKDSDFVVLSMVLRDRTIIILREVGDFERSGEGRGVIRPVILKVKNYEACYINLIKEYIELEYKEIEKARGKKLDISRVIEDIGVLLLFAGNDYVRYQWIVDVAYGSLDTIFRIYKDYLRKGGEHIAEAGNIHWENLNPIVQELAKCEAKIITDLEAEEKAAKIEKEKKIEEIKTKIETAKAAAEIKKEIQEKLEEKKENKEEVENDEEYKNEDEEFHQVQAEETKAKKKPEKKAESPEKGRPFEVDEKVEEIEEPEEAAAISADEDEEEPLDTIEKEKERIRKSKLSIEVYEESKAFPGKAYAIEKDIFETRRKYYLQAFEVDITKPEGILKLEKILEEYCRIIQWAAQLETIGFSDWQMFYPYHYSPFFLDLAKYLDLKCDSGKALTAKLAVPLNRPPMTPYQQLLCVLPKYSKNLLPVAYQHLYDDPKSIVSLIHPEEFKQDNNMRESKWDFVKILPIIDLQEIIKFEKEKIKESDLKENEKNRNTIRNPFTLILKDAKVIKKEGEISVSLAATDPKTTCIYDFPSLNYLRQAPISIITSKDTKPNTAANPTDPSYDSIALNLIYDAMKMDPTTLVGKLVKIGYPFQREALISSIITPEIIFSQRYNTMSNRMESSETALYDEAKEEFEKARDRMKMKKIKIYQDPATGEAEVNYVCACRMVDFLAVSRQGHQAAISKSYANKEIHIPGPLLMFSRNEKHYLNLSENLETVAAHFPLGKRCIVTKNTAFGCVGQVEDNTDSLSIQLKITHTITKPILKSFSDHKPPRPYTFITIKDLARDFHMSDYEVNRILSSLIIEVKTLPDFPNKRYNVGLYLWKQVKKLKFHVPYHVMTSPDHWHNWMVSKEGVGKTLKDYIGSFPTLFRLLEKKKIGEKIFADEVFPGAANPEAELLKLYEYVQALPYSKLPFVPMGTRIIEPSFEKSIIEKLKKSTELKEEAPDTYKEYDPTFLYAETSPFGLKLMQSPVSFYLPGDRIIGVHEKGVNHALFGLTGTIIGICGRKLLVNFDKPVLTGSGFWGKCPPMQGAIVDGLSVLNLSL